MAKQDNHSQTNTIVGPGTVLRGDLKIKGSVLIYGIVIGDIEAQGLVRTAKDSIVKGSLTSREAILGGALEGNLITAGRATLGPDSILVGDIQAGLLVVEEGAKFDGLCRMGSEIGKKLEELDAGQHEEQDSTDPSEMPADTDRSR